jgi:hypothetical protein
VSPLITSDRFLELDALPTRIIFVGGGYIAFEFAHVAVRAGARSPSCIGAPGRSNALILTSSAASSSARGSWV